MDDYNTLTAQEKTKVQTDHNYLVNIYLNINRYYVLASPISYSTKNDVREFYMSFDPPRLDN